MIDIKKEKKSSIIITIELIILLISIICVCFVMGIIEHEDVKDDDEFSIIYKNKIKKDILDDGGVIIFKPDTTNIVEENVIENAVDNLTHITYAKKKNVNRAVSRTTKNSVDPSKVNPQVRGNSVVDNSVFEDNSANQNSSYENINSVKNEDNNISNTNTNKVTNNSVNENTNINTNTNTNINTNTDTNTNTNTNTNTIEEEPEIDRTGTYWVQDKKIVWENNSILGIFNNPRYNMKNMIAPGSTSTYVFYVNNKMGFDLNYIMEFSEENEMNVNMMYKLKREDEYIVGDENTWEYYDKLYIDYDIANEGRDKYILEWKWIDTDNDTEVGVNYAREIYKLNINVMATQISGFEDEEQDNENSDSNDDPTDNTDPENTTLDDTNETNP